MDRRQIIDALNRLAFAAEILDDDRADPKALSGSAWNLRSLEGDIIELHRDGTLQGLRNINNSVKTMVGEIIDNGTIGLLDELEAKIPAGLFDVRKVKGLGPKKVRALWEQLDITSLAELEQACSENRLVDLKGFGQKTQEKVLAGVKQARAFAGLARLDVATALAGRVQAQLSEVFDDASVTVVGNVRRGTEITDAVSLLMIFAAEDADDLEETVGGELVALSDNDDLEVVATLAAEAGALSSVSTELEGLKVKVFTVDSAENFGAALVATTGSDAFLAAVQAHAKRKGFARHAARLVDAGGTVVPTPSEAALFAALDLRLPPPERREAHVPLVATSAAAPRLLRREDLTGALHNHTVASDGGNTLEQMRDEAIALKLGYLGISEHSQSAVYAGGLQAAALDSQRAQIEALNADAKGKVCPILHGVESDILPDGSLDYADDTLRELTHVIASVHARGRLDRDGFTQRMVRAAEHPWTDVIGHPTGRLLLGRAPSDYDTDALLDACERCGTAVELNASPARLDLGEDLLAQAKERNILVSISADAHSTRALSHIDYGVTIARRAGLGPNDVLNARPLDAVVAWLNARKAKAAAAAASA